MYDVLMIGAGPASLYAAYELLMKNENLRIVIFETQDFENWKNRNTHTQIEKHPRNQDSAENILGSHIGKVRTDKLIKYAKNITKQVTDCSLTADCAEYRNQTLTDKSLGICTAGSTNSYGLSLLAMEDKLIKSVEFRFHSPVNTISLGNGTHRILSRGKVYEGKTCMISVGKMERKWIKHLCKSLKLPYSAIHGKPELRNTLEMDDTGLFIAGDAAGLTHSYYGAAASGIHAARCIVRKIR